MTLYQLLAIGVAIAMLVGVPALLIGSMISHFRTRPSDRRGSGSQTAGIGAAMEELDRLLARPSTEHVVEAETPALKREDDRGGN